MPKVILETLNINLPDRNRLFRICNPKALEIWI